MDIVQLLGTKGIANRSKDATRGGPGLTTSYKKLLGTKGIIFSRILTTSNKKLTTSFTTSFMAEIAKDALHLLKHLKLFGTFGSNCIDYKVAARPFNGFGSDSHHSGSYSDMCLQKHKCRVEPCFMAGYGACRCYPETLLETISLLGIEAGQGHGS